MKKNTVSKRPVEAGLTVGQKRAFTNEAGSGMMLMRIVPISIYNDLVSEHRAISITTCPRRGVPVERPGRINAIK